MNINKILALPINKGYSIRGADMGRRRLVGSPGNLYLQRLNMSSCGCYDAGGAYWGQGEPLYCAFSEDGETRVFTRAANRDDAKTRILEDLDPGAWKFLR